MGREVPSTEWGRRSQDASRRPGVLARTFLCYHTPKSFIYLIKQTNLGQVGEAQGAEKWGLRPGECQSSG